MATKVFNFGVLNPHSTLLIYLVGRSTICESSACVRPRAFRTSCIRLPTFCASTQFPLIGSRLSIRKYTVWGWRDKSTNHHLGLIQIALPHDLPVGVVAVPDLGAVNLPAFTAVDFAGKDALSRGMAALSLFQLVLHSLEGGRRDDGVMILFYIMSSMLPSPAISARSRTFGSLRKIDSGGYAIEFARFRSFLGGDPIRSTFE